MNARADLAADMEVIRQAANQVWPELAKMPELKADYPALTNFGGEGDVFMIFAHSDDELTVLSAVIRLKRLNPNRRIHWIMASDNGKGQVIPGTCFGKSKSECRLLEATRVATACAGIEAPVSLGFPDGGLASVADLKGAIANAVDARNEGGRPIAAFFSSDDTGLYGHPDHIAVHDAVLALASERKVPFVSVALPELIKKLIPMNPAGKDRIPPPISHLVELDDDLQARLSCANDAYQSQAITILKLRFGLPGSLFHALIPRQFFNVNAAP